MNLLRKLRMYAGPSLAFMLALSLNANSLALPASLSRRSLPPKRSAKLPVPDKKPASSVDPETKKQISETYGKLPLSFEVNRGQTDPQVKFMSRGSGYSLFLTPEDAVIALRAPSRSSSNQSENSSDVLRMRLVGANRRPKIVGLDQLDGKTNYFIGNNPRKWQTNVPSYSKVKYESVYPGIDMVYYGNQQQLEYDFVVAPDADPGRIKLHFEGMDAIHLDESGDLVLKTNGRELRQLKPITYQVIDGERRDVSSRYEVVEDHVRFQLGQYDRSKPLIIDPVISYSTYLGGVGGYDFGWGITVDAAGNAYVAGETSSPNFPVRNALQPTYGGGLGAAGDAFVTKLNATGTQFLFSTYLGSGSLEAAQDIALDPSGNIYVTGWTSSTTFPVTAGAFQTTGGSNGNIEVFVTKLNSTGSALLYSTYITGRDRDYGLGIAVDATGSAYVTGRTQSTNFPVLNAVQPTLGGGSCIGNENCYDAFVTKLNATGSGLVYSTYLGGNDDDRPDWNGGGIAVDSSGSAYVTGVTRSTNFPTANAIQPTHGPGQDPSRPEDFNADVFVTKFAATGQSLVYSTYLGGPGNEEGRDIVVDSENFAYITGAGTGANGYPITPGAYLASGPGFVTKISVAGDALVFSTNLEMHCNGLAVDSAGNVFVTGSAFVGGVQPAHVSKLNSTGTALLFSFQFGGNETEFNGGFPDGDQEGHDIALDSSGNMYVTGNVFADNFPVTSGAPQQTFGGNICGINSCNDGFVTKIVDVSGFTISGHITDSGGNSLNAVKVSLSGGLKTYAYSDFSGNYSFPNLMPNRNYTVTPTKEFFTFAPVNRAFTNLTSNQTADFVGTLPNVTISGSVSNASNQGIGGVTVTLSGAQSQTTQTNAVGSYTFSGVPSGNTYTVTPSRGSDTFDPVSKTFTNIANNQVANFKIVYQISGQVTDAAGVPAPAVTITLSGSKSAVVETDASGNYLIPNLPINGNYTLTPSKPSILTHNFTPPTQTFTNLVANQTANFSFTTSTSVSLFPVADAYVQDGTTAATNFGSATPLLLKTANQSGQRRDVYMKFDLSTVSRNITSAKLRFTAALTAAGDINTSAYSVVDTAWLESDPGGINWNNKPVRSGTALPGATVAVTTTTFATYELDVTGYITAEKAAGRDVISVALHNPSNSSNHITLHSREATANKPQLLLTTSSSNNAAPTVSLSANGAPFTAPANITLNANAADSDGTISKVDFYAGTSLIGTDTSSPYSFAWNSVATGTYSLTACATDNSGLSSCSNAVNVSVQLANILPQVTLTSPAGGLSFPAGGNITLAANASDPDGSISKVDFFAGSVLVGTDNSSPYQVTWTNASAGAHSLTAVATDNSGATTTSSPVNITVVWKTGLTPVADAYVRDGSSAATNFGTAVELRVQTSATAGSNQESYIKFDLTTVSGITNAKLRLFGALSDGSATNVPAAVHSVATTTWVESGSGSLTWNNKPAAGTALATTTITNNVARWYEWDITAFIQGEKAAGRNTVSLVVKTTTSSTAFATFNSREATSTQPQLQITSTAARNILLVTGSSTLNSSESALKTRLENLGFTVTVKAAGSNNNSAVKTTDADGKAAVVISSTVTPANVAAKFRHVPLPVVLWEADLLDDQGMTGTSSGVDFGTTTNQTQLAIIDPAHPIAAGLTGTTSVVSTASSFTWGKPNANAAKIASLTGDATRIAIFGYDTAAAMPGLPAPARRVAFFITDTNGVSLTANGTALFDAAIKWATASSVAPTLSTLSPSSGGFGTSVTISGYNFGDTQGSSVLTFNGVAATPASWTSSSITAPVPNGASTGPVLVVVNGLVSNPLNFTVNVPPLDSDGDGLADAWELQYFGNLNQNATGDPDGDGVNNLQEYLQGRNPTTGAEPDVNGGVNLRLYTPLQPISP